MKLEKTHFGTTRDGTDIWMHTVTNAGGMVLKMLDYGATLYSVEVPDRSQRAANITLGFPSLDGYLQRHPYFGSTVGRFCNRISGGRFWLDGKEYTLATNDGLHHLHGGIVGFDRVVWRAEPVLGSKAAGIKYHYLSPDGEEGYPGNLTVEVLYLLTSQNEIKMEFTASSDHATPVNLTNHTYWNLSGAGSGTILEHDLLIAADLYLPVDEGLIPTGELAPVEGTPLDFRTPKKIGAHIQELSTSPVGYDHCYALRSQDGVLALAARLSDPLSGRIMEVYTTQPGIQLYTGNFLDGSQSSGGYQQYAALCLETQHYPDSPNQPDFPSTILRPGQELKLTTIHKFWVEP